MRRYDLGTYGRPGASADDEAQAWFDQGLVWTYAYNHEEAVACFGAALDRDPGCALAHWGVAYALGPNYNKPWEAFEPDEKPDCLAQARAAIEAGLACAKTDVERALLGALAARYPEDAGIESFEPWNDAFAAAMRKVHQAHPTDLDVTAVFAESIMNRTPWQLWDLGTGKPAEGADTAEAIAVLDRAFESLPGAWAHPGLLHMYIHLMEMSPHPERALRHGDALVGLVPDAGHLVHMATHIDVLCGDYLNVVVRNQAAVAVDRKYLAHRGAENFYSVYRCHNHHFVVYGALFLGQPAPALAAADELIASLPAATLRPMADWFEGFVPMRQHVLVRFGMWEEILAQELPEDAELFCVTAAMMRYARTLALANLGRAAEAEAELAAFQAARAAVPESRMLFNNTCRDILAVADRMAHGEVAYHAGRHDEAFALLREAIALDDGLPYDEPWGWMQPVRHALGALLLEQGRTEEAEAVYRADLGMDPTLARACQHRDNLWSLHGLVECLERRGADGTGEGVLLRHKLEQAVARASVPVRASCFCRGRRAA
ncbi:tetratricopeptide repeat protein [Albimonas sp. CAU 1670]|uniref:tetratricopeptide repeat protein n=1 Tax=Albimonas sp. CAU 1670 TaxID=3032599 RepID=UPI0023D99622|nr:tetratricopeptide repeat protein [Albimonas sp. CAU 1670]MDF2234749.1 tetratricopeptide repeat protein [Albimonas sp. CAU 1670]